jgi:hypothetical protein
MRVLDPMGYAACVPDHRSAMRVEMPCAVMTVCCQNPSTAGCISPLTGCGKQGSRGACMMHRPPRRGSDEARPLVRPISRNRACRLLIRYGRHAENYEALTFLRPSLVTLHQIERFC